MPGAKERYYFLEISFQVGAIYQRLKHAFAVFCAKNLAHGEV
jgi:hypothetical protein